MFDNPQRNRTAPRNQPQARSTPRSHAVGQTKSQGDFAVLKPESMGLVLDISEFINNALKGFGIVAGGILASVADWVLGTITVAILFESAQEILGFSSWITGVVWSGAMWGIQLILWQLVLSGQVKDMFEGAKWQKIANGILLVIILIMKFGDDYIDMASITWMLSQNEYQGVMGQGAYNVLITSLKIVTWFLVGFSEAFVSAAFVILRKRAKTPARPRPRR